MLHKGGHRRKRHILSHPAQPQHTNHWAPRTRKRHQQEHRPQRPTESSDPTQHAKGRTCDRPGPRKETTTRQNVTQGVAFPTTAGSPVGVEHRQAPRKSRSNTSDTMLQKSLERNGWKFRAGTSSSAYRPPGYSAIVCSPHPHRILPGPPCILLAVCRRGQPCLA